MVQSSGICTTKIRSITATLQALLRPAIWFPGIRGPHYVHAKFNVHQLEAEPSHLSGRDLLLAIKEVCFRMALLLAMC